MVDALNMPLNAISASAGFPASAGAPGSSGSSAYTATAGSAVSPLVEESVTTLTNLAFYRFVDLGDADALACLREELRELTRRLDLRGTLLIAPEGLNAMVTGGREAIDELKRFMGGRFAIDEASFKEASVHAHSFNRMLVKIKREIIPVGDPELRPAARTARRLAPTELKRWLDEGREIVLLDTRNEYEISVGTFEGAEDLALGHSREFGQKAADKIAQWRGREVVTFCTGGIRCEKASALLLKLGLDEEAVYQLDGGILRYFEENGSAHFRGNCFVFDWRLAVDGNLRPAARAVITEDAGDAGGARDAGGAGGAETQPSFGRHRVPESS